MRALCEKKGTKSRRISIIGALRGNKIIAPFLFDGSCGRSVFETYLIEVLLPALEPGTIIVLDNASFHKGGSIESIVASAGCSLLYLPPYSPDLNPIEHFWSALKYRLKKALEFSSDLFEAALSVFNTVST
jgi:transposase